MDVFGVHLYEKCITYLSGKFFPNCAAIKNKGTGFKAYPYPNIMIPLANWTSYASILK